MGPRAMCKWKELLGGDNRAIGEPVQQDSRHVCMYEVELSEQLALDWSVQIEKCPSSIVTTGRIPFLIGMLHVILDPEHRSPYLSIEIS